MKMMQLNQPYDITREANLNIRALSNSKYNTKTTNIDSNKITSEGTSSTGQGSNLSNQTREQLLKSKSSYEKLIQEHKAKLQDYINNPDAYDNLGLLKNVSPEVRQKIIDGRIKALEKQIQKQIGELEKIIELLK
jgi:hypothetical protein